MAQPSNTYDSYDAKGIREDLQDAIYNVSPEETPVFSSGRRGLKAKSTYHEWQRDELDTPNKDNAVIEGDDRTGQAVTPTDRVGNHTQLMDKPYTISDTEEKVKKAGRRSEILYQRAKKMTELKRDIEAMMLSNNAAVAGNATTARKSGGLGVMLYTNAQHNGAGATASHTSGAPTTAVTAGTNRAFTETLLKAANQSVYSNSGSMPSILCLTPSHKETFSGFAGIAANRNQVKGKRQAQVVGGADVYVGDFGNITVVPNYVHTTANANTAFLLNPDTYGFATLEPFDTVKLAKTGHTQKELVKVQGTLVVTSEAANAKIADLTA